LLDYVYATSGSYYSARKSHVWMGLVVLFERYLALFEKHSSKLDIHVNFIVGFVF